MSKSPLACRPNRHRHTDLRPADYRNGHGAWKGADQLAAKKKVGRKGVGQSSASASSKTEEPSRKRSTAKQRETASRKIATRIAKALSHPLRVQLVTILNDRLASPNELSKELDEGLSQISYHVKVLKDFEMIELVKTEPRRGAVEHYYRATSKVYVPSWIAALWPRSVRRTLSASILEEIEQDLVESIEAGLLADRLDEVMSRDSRTFDGQGREEVEEAATEFYKKFEKAGSDSDRRRRNGEGDGKKIQTTAAVMVFTSLKGRKLKVKDKD
jgi:DNA-binding transcriptional ArsR family regulator